MERLWLSASHSDHTNVKLLTQDQHSVNTRLTTQVSLFLFCEALPYLFMPIIFQTDCHRKPTRCPFPSKRKEMIGPTAGAYVA